MRPRTSRIGAISLSPCAWSTSSASRDRIRGWRSDHPAECGPRHPYVASGDFSHPQPAQRCRRRRRAATRRRAIAWLRLSGRSSLRARVCCRRRCTFCLEATAPLRMAALSIALSLIVVHCGSRFVGGEVNAEEQSPPETASQRMLNRKVVGRHRERGAAPLCGREPYQRRRPSSARPRSRSEPSATGATSTTSATRRRPQ